MAPIGWGLSYPRCSVRAGVRSCSVVDGGARMTGTTGEAMVGGVPLSKIQAQGAVR